MLESKKLITLYLFKNSHDRKLKNFKNKLITNLIILEN